MSKELQTQLLNAVIDKKFESVLDLLGQGVDPNFYVINPSHKYHQMSLLYIATMEHSKAGITNTLLQYGANIDWTNIHGATALIYAVIEGRSNIISTLLNNGADTNINQNWNGTALHWAAEKGNFESVYQLLTHGADATLQNSHGKTPANVALMNGHQQLATLLEHAENKRTKTSDDILAHRTLPVPDMGITTLFNFKSMTATRIFKHFDMQQTRQTEMPFSDPRLGTEELLTAEKTFTEQGGEIDKLKFRNSLYHRRNTQQSRYNVIRRRKKPSA